MADKVKIVDFVEKVLYRKTSPYGPHSSCQFILLNGTSVLCDFIPKIRVGWRVDVIGEWSENSDTTFLADEVERHDKSKSPFSKKKKSKFLQTKEKQNKLFGDNADE